MGFSLGDLFWLFGVSVLFLLALDSRESSLLFGLIYVLSAWFPGFCDWFGLTDWFRGYR